MNIVNFQLFDYSKNGTLECTQAQSEAGAFLRQGEKIDLRSLKKQAGPHCRQLLFAYFCPSYPRRA
jgi:hypothetical protein